MTHEQLRALARWHRLQPRLWTTLFTDLPGKLRAEHERAARDGNGHPQPVPFHLGDHVFTGALGASMGYGWGR